jgi:DNA-binding response OmpR family regulator
MSKKILLIEDEQALADVLEAKLKKEGYEVLVAYDGEEGFKKISDTAPDLILLDIVMPKLNGYEVLEKMNEAKITIPVIIISNSGQPVEIEKTRKLGAVDHLIKTQFDPAEVIIKINNYLNGTIPATMPAAQKLPDGASNEAGIKVLLVEDDRFLRDICGKKLTKEGFNVYEAIDGEQALSYVESVNPDIILLDIILPAIDGFQVLQKIRSNPNEKIAKTPVIMLSNLGQDDDIKKAISYGANNYLVKAHFTTEDIVDKIKKILNIA